MAHTSAHTADPFRSSFGAPGKPRSPFAARRRALILTGLLVLIGVAVLTNYGPLHAYREAQARLQAASTQVAALESQKTELQAELGKLGEAGYLESLARGELTYARPGEEIYILTDGAEGAGASAGPGSAGNNSTPEADTATHPGFFERLLKAIAGLF